MSARPELLPGTLDTLILKTLLFGPRHGHDTAASIQQTTDGVLRVEHGSLYPAVHCLPRDWLIGANCDVPADKTCQYKCYRVLRDGAARPCPRARLRELGGRAPRALPVRV